MSSIAGGSIGFALFTRIIKAACIFSKHWLLSKFNSPSSGLDSSRMIAVNKLQDRNVQSSKYSDGEGSKSFRLKLMNYQMVLVTRRSAGRFPLEFCRVNEANVRSFVLRRLWGLVRHPLYFFSRCDRDIAKSWVGLNQLLHLQSRRFRSEDFPRGDSSWSSFFSPFEVDNIPPYVSLSIV